MSSPLRYPLLCAMTCALLGACGDDAPATADADSSTTDTGATGDTAGGDSVVPRDSSAPVDTATADTTASACTALDLSQAGFLVGNLETAPSYGLQAALSGVGGADEDIFELQFYTDDTGTIDLASAVNGNYGSCEQCVVLSADINGVGADSVLYFQTAGTLVVDEATPPQSGAMKATLTGLELREVTIDFEGDFTSTLVDGGDCFRVAGPIALETEPCEPNCAAGAVCGADGCGGICGAGCDAAETCALDGQSCVAQCETLTVDGNLTATIDAGAFLASTEAILPNVGANAPDAFLFQLFASEGGTFPDANQTIDLGTGDAANYATCSTCLLYVVDNADGAENSRLFFQRAGQVTIAPGSDAAQGRVDATVTGLELVEVGLTSDFTSVPLVGGSCVAVAPMTVHTRL